MACTCRMFPVQFFVYSAYSLLQTAETVRSHRAR